MSKLTPILAVALYFTQGCGSLTNNLPSGYSPFKDSEMPRYGAVTQHNGELSLEFGGCVSKNAATYFRRKGLDEHQILSKYGDGGADQKLRNVLRLHRGRFGVPQRELDYGELPPQWRKIKGKDYFCKPHVLSSQQLDDLISASGNSKESMLRWLAEVVDMSDRVE